MKNRGLIVVFIVFIALLLGVSSFVYLVMQQEANEVNINKNNNNSAIIKEGPLADDSMLDKNTENVEKGEVDLEPGSIQECDGGFCMIKNNGEKTEVVKRDNGYFPVERWKDWFFYGEGRYTNELKVYAINFDSGEKKIIFDSSIYSKIKEEYATITQLAVLDDELYITLGGYIVKGELFYIDLNNFSEPKLIIDNDIYLEKRGDTVVGITGDGDAGYVYMEFYSFDKNEKKLKKIMEVSSEMGVGEKVVYYDKGEFIIARTKNINDVFDGPIYNDSYYSINTLTLEKKELGKNYDYPIIPSNRLGYRMDEYIATSNSMDNEPLDKTMEKTSEDSGINKYECGTKPTKISDLKPGDYFNSFKIKSITGDSCEDNCESDYSSNIEFEGEYIISGTFRPIVSASNMSFAPNKKLPWFVLNGKKNKKSGLEGIAGLNCIEDDDTLDTWNPSTHLILRDWETKVLSRIDDFDEFLDKFYKDENQEKYPGNFLIKIDNFSLGFTAGGESGMSADLVEIIEVNY